MLTFKELKLLFNNYLKCVLNEDFNYNFYRNIL